MPTRKVLDRWFESPVNIFGAISNAYEYDMISDDDGRPLHLIFQRNGMTWRISVSEGDSLFEAKQIQAHVLDPHSEEPRTDDWEDDLGVEFHAELLDLLESAAIPVDCLQPGCDEFPILAYDTQEAQVIAEHHHRTTDHTPTIDGEKITTET